MGLWFGVAKLLLMSFVQLYQAALFFCHEKSPALNKETKDFRSCFVTLLLDIHASKHQISCRLYLSGELKTTRHRFGPEELFKLIV